MKRIVMMASLLVLLLLAGCSGGGGGGVGTTATSVSGVASKGLIKNGVVKVFALNADGSKGALLKETTTDANGAYRADLGTYQGAVLVEASGSYTDEATGAIITIPAAAPLRAVVDSVSSETAVAVTPLTELAVQKIEDPSTRTVSLAQIASSNAMIAAAFKVDILKTMPIDATQNGAGGTNAQKEHALVLAAVSELMHKDGKDLSGVLADLKGGIGFDNRLSGAVADSFKSALTDFTVSGSNRTGINDISATTLGDIGARVQNVIISLSGASLLSGVDLVVSLPAGVTVRTDAGGQVADFALKAPAGTLAVAKYTAGSSGGSVRAVVATSSSFPATDFLTLQCVLGDDSPQLPPYGFSIIEAYDSHLARLDLSTLAVSMRIGE